MSGKVAFYNEHNPFAAQWLRNLIEAGEIAPGVVDERDIRDIKPEELTEYAQCHFFAGLGGWSYVLRQAGWPDDRPIWTGSCPCQPFSAAGEGAGFADERHLWPSFHHLIAVAEPAAVVGEQVASSNVDVWIDLVHADLEALGYLFGAVAFPAAGVGAPNLRDRVYWVGHTQRARLEGYGRHVYQGSEPGRFAAHTFGPAPTSGATRWLADADRRFSAELAGLRNGPGEAASARSPGAAPRRRAAADAPAAGPANGFWSVADWLFCRDVRFRAVEPGTQPLAHGIEARVGRLSAYGNAINAEAGIAFMKAYMDHLEGRSILEVVS